MNNRKPIQTTGRFWTVSLALLFLNCAQFAWADKRPNVIVIFTDDHGYADLSCQEVLPDVRTPNIDKLAAESVVFEDAWAVSNETLYSHAALFTSRYATETGPIFDTFKLADTFPTLASVLGVYGYESAAFVGGGHLSASFELGRGFDRYHSSGNWGDRKSVV